MIAANRWMIALALSASLANGQTPPLSFKGIEFGKSTASDVKEKFPGATSYDSGSVHADARYYADKKCGTIADSVRNPSVSQCRSEALSDQLFRIGQTSSGDLFFELRDGLVEDVRASFPPSSFPAVAAALAEKY